MKKTLIDYIRERLEQYEEPYVLGSWERFQVHRARKVRLKRIKRWSAVAAVLLIAGTLYGAYNQFIDLETVPGTVTETVPDEIPAIQEHPSISEIQPAPDSEDIRPGYTIPERESLADRTDSEPATITSQRDQDRPDTTSPATAETGGEVVYINGIDGQLPSSKSGRMHLFRDPFSNLLLAQILEAPHVMERAQTPSGSPIFTLDPADDEIDPHVQPATRGSLTPRDRNLRFSLAYASVMHVHDAQTDLSMGGGFFTDFAITDRFALSSGFFIAQNQLRYDNPPTSGRVATLTTDNAEQSVTSGQARYMQADLLSMEIPFNIRYRLTDSFTLTAGLSSLAYLKESFHFRYDYQQPVQTFTTLDSGEIQTETRMVTVSETVTDREPAMNRMNWAAFYNLSVDYQLQIAHRYDFSVEPFVKIPTGRVTAHQITYTTGGLQVRYFF
jgi:hypothetical protein